MSKINNDLNSYYVHHVFNDVRCLIRNIHCAHASKISTQIQQVKAEGSMFHSIFYHGVIMFFHGFIIFQ